MSSVTLSLTLRKKPLGSSGAKYWPAQPPTVLATESKAAGSGSSITSPTCTGACGSGWRTPAASTQASRLTITTARRTNLLSTNRLFSVSPCTTCSPLSRLVGSIFRPSAWRRSPASAAGGAS